MFGVRIPGHVLADRIAMKAQLNTVYASQRPYGTSVIMASHDSVKGPALFMLEPSG
jgi:20S proteasome alpha/beta subunit